MRKSEMEAKLPGHGDADPTQELGPYFDTASLCQRLGVKRQALGARVRRRTLLGVEADDGSLLYPSWQFTADMAVLDGLPQLLRVLSLTASDGLSQAMWLTSRQARFAGHTAVEVLAEGTDLESLISAARADAERLAH